MNLSENLKKIRKDNNLSQEDLAEKLGVSRQSVSKWESGLAYPEMDKVLQICKMFNLNIDELLNQNIKEVEKTKKSSININKYIDDFLNYVTKTVNMFSNMKFKDKIKCILEQIIIILLFIAIISIAGKIIFSILNKLLNFLPCNIHYSISNVLEGVYYLLACIFGIIIVLHIFKTRYLDYYVVVDSEDENADEETIVESKEKKEYIKRKEEKIIIRDPKHSSYRFINGLLKVLLFFIKLFVCFIGFWFCISLVCFVIMFVLSFLFIKTGLLFLGAIIGLMGCIIINLIILDVLYCFIKNRKSKSLLLFTLFICSLILIGVSIAFILMSSKDFRYINSYDENYIVRKEEKIKMNKNLVIYYPTYFVETKDKDVKVVYEYSPLCDTNLKIYNNEIMFEHNCNDKKIIDYYINTINDKVLIDPDYFKVTIYTNSENIKTIKNNNKYN